MGGLRRANRLSCRFVLLVFFAPVGTCFLNRIPDTLSVAGTHWRQKSGAIIASPGEKSGLEDRHFNILDAESFSECEYCAGNLSRLYFVIRPGR